MKSPPPLPRPTALRPCSRGHFARICAALALAAAPALGQGSTLRVSVDSQGQQANGDSVKSRVDADGRKVAFTSWAEDLVPGDTNGLVDVFVRDLSTGQTRIVSRDAQGQGGNHQSFLDDISADGRFVSFSSLASDLVPGDSGNWADVFVKDLTSGALIRASVDAAGNEALGNTLGSSLSSDGRFVAFASFAANLVPGDTNGEYDIFVKDLLSGAVERVSVGPGGVQGNGNSARPAISGDGRYVAFDSDSTNLVPLDTNNFYDAFVHDRLSGQTLLASVTAGGLLGNGHSAEPDISDDGRFVAFQSLANNFATGGVLGFDVFVKDMVTGDLLLASPGPQLSGECILPQISANGRWIAFESTATMLVPGDLNNQRDVFVTDRLNAEVRLASLGFQNQQGNGMSLAASLSGDGRLVFFSSFATNLVPGDTNGRYDVFAHERGCLGDVQPYCMGKVNSAGCTPALTWSGSPKVSVVSGFTIAADQLLVGQLGVFIYSTAGPAAQPFQGGTLCVQPPVARIGQQVSTGAGPCGGHMELDFNAHVHTGVDPALVAGAAFWGQFWSRDPGDPFGSSLSNAIQGTVCP